MFERRVRQGEWGEIIPELGPGPCVGCVELHKAQWMLAAQWRKKAVKACAEVGLTFTEWLILDALRELYQELSDAVSQNAIAARAGLRRGTVSEAMPGLEKKALISRGPSASGPALRLFPTRDAKQLLNLLHPRLEAISRAPSALW